MNNINRYQASFPVQTQFITNADKTGDHIFTQLKRQGNVCIYRRNRVEDDSIFGYEVVVVKHVKAGTPLPGNTTVQADYEAYGGSGGFGKTAWFCGNEGSAEDRFDKVVKLQEAKELVEDEPVTAGFMTAEVDEVLTVTKVENVTEVIPVGEFTQAMFAQANNLPERGKVYNVLQSLINKGIVKLSDRKKIGAGKPTCYYSKA